MNNPAGRRRAQDLQERYCAALSQIVELTKTLITVSTGTLALSATLLKNFGSDSYLPLLYGAWAALATSTVFGILAILESIGNLARISIKNPVRNNTLQWCNGVQLAALLTGLTLLGIFAVANVNKPSEKPPPSGIKPTIGPPITWQHPRHHRHHE
ncbi:MULTISPECIES: hypothetical protein [Streptomyces]|uniref:hypothetical protein n=1 Tax=Streptomyces TaxID=1883 RepID=UPI00345B7543